ncbi:MAG: hypothetical protein ACNS60_18705 [Candidatus Cyclobacteriaceae bacterium M2_1C_046]
MQENKDYKEDKNRKIGMAVSIGVHAVLALIFIFIMAWREPNPPHPEYGIELNFGMDEAAGGEIQPEEAPTEETDTEEETQTEEAIEEPVEEEAVEETVEEPVEEVVEETAVTTQESPVTVPEVKEEKKVEKPKEEKKEPAKTPTETKAEEQKEEKKVEVTYPAKENTSTPSQGDKTGTGDQGDPEGELDERALYGKPGGGGGSSLNMEGWNWDWIPKPQDTSDENGIIKFEIKVNADGEVISVRTLERSVSPAVEKIYRAEVEKLTFSRKTSSGNPPPVSKGTITFAIKSK